MAYYYQHLFFCVNERNNGKKCCQDANALAICDYAKSLIKQKFPQEKIRVSRAGCLGRCEIGPCLVIYPSGTWYTYHSQIDIEEIIESHLGRGEIVKRLLLDPLPSFPNE